MKWGHEADAKLLAAVIRIHNIKLDYPALAAAMGDDCTSKALMHRFAKLKSVANGIGTLDSATPTTTPAKRGRAKKTTTGATENGNVDDVDDEEEDATPAKKRGVKRVANGGDYEVTPVKKPRAKRGAKAAAKKQEESDGEDGAGVDEGDDGEYLPLGQEIKIEDGVIKLQQGGEED
ncbi:hypothetical protein MMC30_001418 [Trapelia coarctata]|nr:hypothetical protein [Trapelia coarctata]